jgi:hypothetical protein
MSFLDEKDYDHLNATCLRFHGPVRFSEIYAKQLWNTLPLANKDITWDLKHTYENFRDMLKFADSVNIDRDGNRTYRRPYTNPNGVKRNTGIPRISLRYIRAT